MKLDKEKIITLKKKISEKKYDLANRIIVRCMEYHLYIEYAVYAAEQVIDFFKEEYPSDDRPGLAINEAKKCIENPSATAKATARIAAGEARIAAEYAFRDAWNSSGTGTLFSAGEAASAASAAASAAGGDDSAISRVAALGAIRLATLAKSRRIDASFTSRLLAGDFLDVVKTIEVETQLAMLQYAMELIRRRKDDN